MDQPPPEDDDARHRANLIGLGVVFVIVVLGVALLLLLKHYTALQDCLAAGHHDCATIDTSQGQ